MPVLKFKGFPHSDHYNGPAGLFVTGQEQEVSGSDAAYLLETFGEAFEAVGSAPSKPSKTRAVKSPTKRRAAPSKAKKGDQ
jgi:hypothetical protein